MKEPISKLVALAFIFVAATAKSQTLNWSSQTQSSIVDSEGVALDNSYVFELGAFNAGFVPEESNVGEWLENWHVFDTADYSEDPLGGSFFTGSQTLQSVTDYPAMFQGLTAYIWIRDITNSQYFLASATAKPGIQAWTFPNLDPNCCANGQVTTWSVSDLVTDTPIWGGQDIWHGPGEYDGTGGPYDIQTHVVPEPASALLAMLSVGFASFRRRRLQVR